MVEESLGLLEQSGRFLKPVFADDTIYPALEVTEATPGRSAGVVCLRPTVFNQGRELVLEGLQKFSFGGGPPGRDRRHAFSKIGATLFDHFVGGGEQRR
jgi:hypothetical protein